MFPGDATFVAHRIPTGRVYILKFSSSSQRLFYWLQTKPEKPDEPGHFSNRDKEYGEAINRLLRGEEHGDDSEDMLGDDEDETMEDVERRDEGAESREGGADGGRAASASAEPAPTSASAPAPATVSATSSPTNQSSFLQSLISSISVPASTNPANQSQSRQPPLSLSVLLPPSATLPLLSTLTEHELASLMALLPPTLPPTTETLEKVLRSPQFTQSLGALTVAGVCESLGVDLGTVGVEVRRNGGDGVGAFVEGVRKQVLEKMEQEEREDAAKEDRMEE
ncbi:hypothetical protein BDZ91DRAFT_735942 [Kalaharituber pfeilii]|nr:hypothetical protein BDZ91DRAFT_735942 [Kalaharituber pfeilii]